LIASSLPASVDRDRLSKSECSKLLRSPSTVFCTVDPSSQKKWSARRRVSSPAQLCKICVKSMLAARDFLAGSQPFVRYLRTVEQLTWTWIFLSPVYHDTIHVPVLVLEPGLEIHVDGPKSVTLSVSELNAFFNKSRLTFQERPVERTLVSFIQGVSSIMHSRILETLEDCIEGSLFGGRLIVIDISQVCAVSRDVHAVVVVANACWEGHTSAMVRNHWSRMLSVPPVRTATLAWNFWSSLLTLSQDG
jgi:hypothetical protein